MLTLTHDFFSPIKDTIYEVQKFLRGVFIGDYNVGKTSLATRIFDDKFNKHSQQSA